MTRHFDHGVGNWPGVFFPPQLQTSTPSAEEAGLLERLGRVLCDLDSRLRGGSSANEFSDLVQLKAAVMAAISVLKAGVLSHDKFLE